MARRSSFKTTARTGSIAGGGEVTAMGSISGSAAWTGAGAGARSTRVGRGFGSGLLNRLGSGFLRQRRELHRQWALCVDRRRLFRDVRRGNLGTGLLAVDRKQQA